MSVPTSAKALPRQTPNTSAPIGQVDQDLAEGALYDGLGKPVTGHLTLYVQLTAAWRYLFGTFVQRSSSVNPNFTLTAGAAYSQSQLQTLIAQVEALSKVVGSQ